MKKTDLSTVEADIDREIMKKTAKRKKAMKVSGSSVKTLARIIKSRLK